MHAGSGNRDQQPGSLDPRPAEDPLNSPFARGRFLDSEDDGNGLLKKMSHRRTHHIHTHTNETGAHSRKRKQKNKHRSLKQRYTTLHRPPVRTMKDELPSDRMRNAIDADGGKQHPLPGLLPEEQ